MWETVLNTEIFSMPKFGTIGRAVLKQKPGSSELLKRGSAERKLSGSRHP
jgi:hypothetical protein